MDPSHAMVAEPVAESLWLVFVGGFAGSAHCLGMCGPLVTMAESLRPGRWTVWSNLPLHVGRIATYSLLGVIAGLVGSGFERGGVAIGLQGAAAILGGVLMVLFALVMIGWVPFRWGVSVGERAAKRIATAMSSHRPSSGFVMGLYWGLLPCGLVWMFLARAAAEATAWGGAAVMLAFGAGTVPALLVLGGLAGYISARLRQKLQWAGAVVLIVMGILIALRGAANTGWIGHLKLARGVPLF